MPTNIAETVRGEDETQPHDNATMSARATMLSSSTRWAIVLRDVRLIGGLQRLDESVPRGSVVRVLRDHIDQLLVYYAGDGDEHGAAEGLIDVADVAGSNAPKWVKVRRGVATVRSSPSVSSPILACLQRGAVLEVLEDAGDLLRVYSVGNGREHDTFEGWVDVDNLVAAGSILGAESRGLHWLDSARVSSIRAGNGVWLNVPYRTQLDGSRSATSNCGPVCIAMALEHFHFLATNEEVRSIAEQLQGTPYPDVGFAIEYLQGTVEALGMNGLDLYDGKKFKRWTLDDLRAQILSGRPVVAQLRFRMMPNRSDSDYLEDHYVLICGVQGDDFIYNDPVDSDGPGYGRIMSAEQLASAWGSSYFPFAAFAVSP